MTQYVELTLALLVLLLIIAVNLAMFVSLGKQGDERRKAIVQKASSNTFSIVVLYILFSIIENIFSTVTQSKPVESMNPIILLTVISIIYAVQLIYYKRKLGD